MKKSNNNVGIILIVIAAVILCSRVFGFAFAFILKGWWTAFIIVPCFMGLVRPSKPGKKKTGYVVGLIIGLWLLINTVGGIFNGVLYPLLPVIIIGGIGFSMLHKGKSNCKRDAHTKRTQYYQEPNLYEEPETIKDGDVYYQKVEDASGNPFIDPVTGKVNLDKPIGPSHEPYAEDFADDIGSTGAQVHNLLNVTALLSSKEIKPDGDRFNGGTFTATFGSIELDLRHAAIYDDIELELSVLCGSIEILCSDNVRVEMVEHGVLSSVVNKTRPRMSLDTYIPKVTVSATCTMGSIEVK
jgi:hypothetical protein